LFFKGAHAETVSVAAIQWPQAAEERIAFDEEG
jgi:hypothetical protein